MSEGILKILYQLKMCSSFVAQNSVIRVKSIFKKIFSFLRDDTDFDLFWADRGWMREYFDQCFMEDHVRINHFRNHYEVS